MSQVEVDYLGEGASDEAIARKMIISCAGSPGMSYRRPQVGTGKQSLDRRLAGLNAGVAHGRPILILRDLDHDAACAGELVAALLPNRHPRLLLRVCVREAEAWLLADGAAYAQFCGISVGQIPSDPEALDDPKQVILSWVANARAVRLKRYVDDARRRAVADWASLGAWHAEFAERIWDPERAAASGKAPSLARSITRLEALLKRE